MAVAPISRLKEHKCHACQRCDTGERFVVFCAYLRPGGRQFAPKLGCLHRVNMSVEDQMGVFREVRKFWGSPFWVLAHPVAAG